jgi:hypothetical protein
MWVCLRLVVFLAVCWAPLASAQGLAGSVPVRIPGLIEIEDFDQGGEGVGYHDTDPANNGPVGSNYRPTEGVDIGITPDGSGSQYQVGWTRAGEWLKYTVDVAVSGPYTMTMRAGTVYSGTGGRIHLEVDGVDVTGPITIVTGVWLGYSTIRVPNIVLNAGRRVVKLSMDANSSTGSVGDFNWMHFELTSPTQSEPPVVIQEPTPASTFYVSPSGDDSNPGTMSLPWRTLAKAAGTLTAGQAVYVRAGTYRERLIPQNSGTDGNYIIFSAYPGETVVIDGTGVVLPRLQGLVNIRQKSYVRVSGFRVVNAGVNVPDGTWNFGIATQASDHIVIDRNYIGRTYSIGLDISQFSNHVLVDGNEVTDTNFGSSDNEVAVAIIWFSHHVEVRNNFVHHGNNEGIDPVAGVHDVTVHHNTVSHMGRQGIYVDSWTEYQYNITYFNNVSHDNGLINGNGGFAISAEEGGMLQNVSFYNNLSYNNEGHGFIVTSWGSNSHRIDNVTIVNNTVYNNGQEGITIDNSEATNVLIRNNIAYRDAGGSIVVRSAGSVTQDHNLTFDPKFVNAASGDFRLQAGSPAIDAGSSNAAPLVDFSGRPRPVGTAFDIGAYEFAPSTAPPAAPTAIRVKQ